MAIKIRNRMVSTFQSSSSGLRATNAKFFSEDIYVPTTVTDATVDVYLSLEKLQSTSYACGQVLLGHGYDQDSLAATKLEVTTNAGTGWTALNPNTAINHSEFHTFRIPVTAGNYVNLRHSVVGKTVMLKQAIAHYNVPPRR